MTFCLQIPVPKARRCPPSSQRIAFFSFALFPFFLGAFVAKSWVPLEPGPTANRPGACPIVVGRLLCPRHERCLRFGSSPSHHMTGHSMANHLAISRRASRPRFTGYLYISRTRSTASQLDSVPLIQCAARLAHPWVALRSSGAPHVAVISIVNSR